MRPLQLTNKTISNLQPESTPVSIKDSILKGFGVKVNLSGQVKFIVEACRGAISLIADIKSGAHEIKQKDIFLGRLLGRYTSGDRLKSGTVQDYKEAVNFYLQDWLI